MSYRRNFLLSIAATVFTGILITSVGCGGGSSAKSNSIVTSGGNVAQISVNGGPNGNYANGVFVSVTVCAPSTSTCQTIPNVLVDTGSSGLRILSSVMTISLPQQTGSSGPVVECLPFISGYTWGPVQTADVQIGGEKASAVPIQTINETAFPVPTACSNQGPAMDSVQTLGTNGILGIGLAGPDCFACSPNSGLANPNLYYACPTSGCQPITQTLTNQVQNPVALFPTDNNGVIVELPSLSSPAPSLIGSLVFGIGTQSNNALHGATVYTVDQFGNFTTSYNGKSYSGSFIDSGSNGYFFLNSALTGIPDCGGSSNSFYCPASSDNLTAMNQGASGGSGTVNFSVTNADSMFNSNNFAFPNLAGPVGTSADYFDWGLPFFFGRNVYVAIDGQSTPGGSGPFWAY